MLPPGTGFWQPEFTEKILSRKTGAVQNQGLEWMNSNPRMQKADLFFSRGAVWRKGFGNAGKIGCLPEKRMRKYPVGEIANHP